MGVNTGICTKSFGSGKLENCYCDLYKQINLVNSKISFTKNNSILIELFLTNNATPLQNTCATGLNKVKQSLTSLSFFFLFFLKYHSLFPLSKNISHRKYNFFD